MNYKNQGYIDGQEPREITLVVPQKTNGWNSCQFHVYKYQGQTKLGSISLKPKACGDIYLPSRSGGTVHPPITKN